MPIETIEFNGIEYPAIQAKGGASLWIREIANQYCDGIGLDIGYSKPEWKYPMAVGIDESLNNGYHAMNLPDSKDCDLHNEPYGWPFIHSSHCLEHVKENWYNVLDYWLTCIRVGGIIFLYLPHKSQEYWLPKNNRKHVHSFDGSEITDYFRSLGHKVMLSGVDFNHSFVVVCEKRIPNHDLFELAKKQDIQSDIQDSHFINTVSIFDKLSFNGDVITADTKINLSYALNEEYQRYNGEAKHRGERQLDEWEWINFRLTGKA